MSTTALRVLYAVVALILIVPPVYLFGQPAVNVLCGLAVLVGAWEFGNMALKQLRLLQGVLLLISGAVYVSIVWFEIVPLAVLMLAGLSAMLAGLFLTPTVEEGQQVGSRMALGLLYVPVTISFAPQLYAVEQGWVWFLFVFGVTACGDIGGYFAGRAFGKYKLFERVSPKKTWEGVVGGYGLAIIFAIIIVWWLLPQIHWAHAILLTLLVNTAGVVGDLVESMLKRAYNVKDSGSIMGPHGGILDRTDSQLFSIPVAYIYLTSFGLV